MLVVGDSAPYSWLGGEDLISQPSLILRGPVGGLQNSQTGEGWCQVLTFLAYIRTLRTFSQLGQTRL